MRRSLVVVLVSAVLWGGCNDDDDLPASFVAGLRVLAIVADPPQVDQGASSNLKIYPIDTEGRAIDVSWSRCLLAPLPGEAVNAKCVNDEAPNNLEPLGTGLELMAQMPAFEPGALGQPDSSNGIYLPLVARVTAGDAAVTAIYRLRVGDGTPPNLNPTVASVDVIDAPSGPTTLVEDVPLVVHAGDVLTLTATFAPGDDQTYTAVTGEMVKETLRFSWFTTAGTLDSDRTSESEPTNLLTLDERLPESGENVDLFVVIHDERGGVGYTHRSLVLE
jgi:hypothetical protein